MRLLLAAWISVAAASLEYLPQQPGKWHPWRRETNMLGDGEATKNATAIRAACANAQRIHDVFARARALDPPLGANVLRSCGFLDTSFDGGFPVAYNLGMIFKDLHRRCPTCPVEESGEGPGLWVYINTIRPLISQNQKFHYRYLDAPHI